MKVSTYTPSFTTKNSELYFNKKVKSDSENEQTSEHAKEAVLTQKWDEIASGYKKSNPAFKADYENLEEALGVIKAQIERLQEQINKLKTSPIQRGLRLNSEYQSETQLGQILHQHIGAREYQDSSEQAQIDALEQQLGEFKAQEAQIKANMYHMIEEEGKRLEQEQRR
ncbi:hypothetical protein PSECIP111951_01353 [Pseudoalteromonas holothuriae]|uniref:Uncharacterized protein n=1 Tax=Pseudoalteromonas holothuriae TaxID=2963714 RepID=A0A9W4QQP1_9GAMM|nr:MULTISPECIES: hypothetical protein [unclassified Pseudoalteromonas]CAH9049434.1 hypothetical protein PSECIP111854_00067 [Pseudoalteromonas sp. CIP111854]CAH9055946.1 hypothetical protein PSECIP111951_01353 [Pseudoalteromonas sp. CIP111951]